MTHTKSIDPIYRRWICEQAGDLVRSGRFTKKHTRLMTRARSGDDRALMSLEDAVQIAFLSPPVHTPTLLRSAKTAFMHPSVLRRSHIRDHAEAQHRAASPHVMRSYAEKLAHDITHRRRKGGIGSMVVIPPRPGSRAFLEFLSKQCYISPEQADYLYPYDLWGEVLLHTFFCIMGKGLEAGEQGYLSTRRLDIRSRRAWALDMRTREHPSRTILPFFLKQLKQKSHEPHAIRAVAWLSRLLPQSRLQLPLSPLMLELLFDEVALLHERYPALGTQAFFSLLTPYTQARTIPQLIRLVREKGHALTPQGQLMLETFLLWHKEPSQGLCNKLILHIMSPHAFRTIAEFCDGILRISPAFFLLKIKQLTSAGVDINPLMIALERRFPTRGGSEGSGNGSTPPTSSRKSGKMKNGIFTRGFAPPATMMIPVSPTTAPHFQAGFSQAFSTHFFLHSISLR